MLRNARDVGVLHVTHIHGINVTQFVLKSLAMDSSYEESLNFMEIYLVINYSCTSKRFYIKTNIFNSILCEILKYFCIFNILFLVLKQLEGLPANRIVTKIIAQGNRAGCVFNVHVFRF